MSDPVPVRHVSVLPREVLRWLDPRPGQLLADCTTGVGGHARLLAERVAPGGRVIGLDQDAAMLGLARPRLEGLPVTLVHAPFDQLPRVLREQGVERLDGVLADLGVCSDQLDAAGRGFSFAQEGPLDMRMNRDETETAAEMIHRLSERDLADVIFRYGEERFSRRIAKRIVEERKKAPIETTTRLAELVRRCVPRGKGIDPATRTFQGLRIAVNDEMGALERLLESLPAVLKPGGVAVLISFHSLEDRPVKRLFRDHDTWDELTRKPVTAAEDESATNPRSRSAKLRAGRLKVDGAARA
ncbi:MAG: 16S rRNA (cytosine(1402)-N(4))-methyltransferase RsmH [Gemmataceae bacterium]